MTEWEKDIRAHPNERGTRRNYNLFGNRIVRALARSNMADILGQLLVLGELRVIVKEALRKAREEDK